MSQVKGLCVMDVDGTLIAEEVIDLLGREAGCEEEISQITSQTMRGELDFERSLRARVALLKGLPVSVFDTVFKSIHLSKNAQEFISILQKNGILVGLVSGGFTPIVERLAKFLGISYFSANQLEVKDGFLTGKLVGEIVTAQVKQATLEKWRMELEIPKERTIAIGDGANDLLMLKSAGHAIAFCAKEVVKAEIACHVDERDFLEALPLIDFLE
ncbi:MULTISPECIES: phosphoserine phosphatase SerB [Streptococcus]|uniref:phosphoserine phosphatase SerB n=1 Tax=Streptococcus TaxID=1301 RepID=UPI00025AA96A|nr:MULTISPECIES: phosphoserine phosphatase SerB [Streptococcus]EID26684.1 phosphoserine phosphatase SerB [Streptococcus oralis SK1074]EJO21588.1 phosphoserine phosphatase SerB [Streptococcus sp. BS35b]ETS89279.1 phosphoserine phosphatase SerB [Streptococcus sp. BS29a]EUB29874.1 phosphoserine phosphatase SerB [Streptococcus sp. BS21]MCY7103877.1 phosphoserine phosphatase SerB [Streptococcus oralis]